MEFPKDPTERQRRRQKQISVVISGMQDTCLEVGFVPELVTDPDRLPSDDPDFNWQTYTERLF